MAPPLTIGITLGDPAGVGPEVVRAALNSDELDRRFEYRVFGEMPEAIPGQPTPATARCALQALEDAAAAAQRGEIAAVVTGPIHKARMQAEGFPFMGQTEFFAARSGTENFAMCLTGPGLTVALVTAHEPLHAVPRLLTQAEIVRVGTLLANFLDLRTSGPPRLAVAGLNPHAGEDGALGREEIEIVAPAVQMLAAQLQGRATVHGPFSPDTVFHRTVVGGEFDGVLCMYHDQGLIPLKLHAFDSGVNITLGLPYPRTSPDHGTAFEIAGRGLARPHSTMAAIRLASDLLRRRHE